MSIADEIRSRIASDPISVYAAVLKAASFRQKGSEFYAICPFHDDSKPSLHVNPDNGQWFCDPCGTGGDIFQLYALQRGLSCKTDFPKISADLGQLLGVNGRTSRIIATYDYRDEQGEVLFQKVRYDPKDFCFRRPDGNGDWIWKDALKDVRRVLYRLPQLVAADPSEWIWAPEGEKDADRLAARGFVATTSPFGGSKTPSDKKWPPEFNEFFRNRKAAIPPDNDDTGATFSAYIAEQLLPVATEGRIVKLPAGYKDVSDFFDKGGTQEQLIELLEKAPKETELGQRFRKDKAAAGKPRMTNASAPQAFASALELEKELATLLPSLSTDDLLRRLQDLAARIPSLSPIERAMWREGAIKKLAALVFTSPAKIADSLLPPPVKEEAASHGTEMGFESLEPWAAGAVSGSDLLDELTGFFPRYVVLPKHGETILSLWTLLTYTFDEFSICPLVTITSPLFRCAKSRVLELLGAVVHRPLSASNVTSSTVFRAVEKWRPVLLIDEVDTLPKDGELWGIINSGHSRSNAWVLRTVGDDHEPKRFSTWGPKALAQIGRPRNTIEDRSLLIKMRRKAKHEKVERLRIERVRIELRPLREKALRWAKDNAAALRQAEPELPEGLHDRAADNWEPLLAIADLAGDPWPARARAAAISLAGEAESEAVGVLLLQDIRAAFEECGEDKISSSDLCAYLAKLEHRPWPEWGKQKKPITQPTLAVLLKPFGIAPTDVRIGKSLKGYKLDQFTDAFSRYIPSSTKEGGSEPRHRDNSHGSSAGGEFLAATPETDVAGEKPRKPVPEATCRGVADGNGESRAEGLDPAPDPTADHEEGEL